jgi:hypothetical protein
MNSDLAEVPTPPRPPPGPASAPVPTHVACASPGSTEPNEAERTVGETAGRAADVAGRVGRGELWAVVAGADDGSREVAQLVLLELLQVAREAALPTTRLQLLRPLLLRRPAVARHLPVGTTC